MLYFSCMNKGLLPETSMSLNETSHTLLKQALDLDDQEAWSTINERYRQFCFYIFGQMNFNEADKEDLTQTVLVKLVNHLSGYDRNKGSFRAWLAQIIKNTAFTHYNKRKNQSASISQLSYEIDTLSSNTDHENSIEKEWVLYISSLALDRVKASFTGKSVEVFELGLAGKSTEEIVLITGLKVSSVYSARKRVKKLLLREMESLKNELEL